MISKDTEGVYWIFGADIDRKLLRYWVYRDEEIRASFTTRSEAQAYIRQHRQTDKRKHKYELIEVAQ